jgi:hypothetical protein
MKHGSDPPSQKMGHKTPNNKNDVKLLRGPFGLFGTTFHLKGLGRAQNMARNIPWPLQVAMSSSNEGDNLTPSPKIAPKVDNFFNFLHK